MQRTLLLLLAGYGWRLSSVAGRNIRAIGQRAAAGDRSAARHFTQTRYARLAGVPNSDLGLLFYAAVAVAALSGAVQRPAVHRVLMAASALSLLTSVVLLWALLIRLRVRCTVCLQGHAVNAAIFVALVARRPKPRR